MPTYVCSVAKNSLDDAKRAAVAEAISRVHSEESGAPTYYVQVVFDEKEPTQRFLGGSLQSRHVWIRGDIRSGRTDAQRKAMVLRMVKEVSTITGINESDVWVYLNNLAANDMVEYGHVLPPPGKEAEWFAALPESLQAYLKSLKPV